MADPEVRALEKKHQDALASFSRLAASSETSELKEAATNELVCTALDLAIPLQDPDPERADELYNSVLDLLESKTEFNDITFSGLARAHVGLGILKSEQAIDPDLDILMDAVDHFVSALDIYQQMGDQENMSNTLLHLGPLHARIAEPQEAVGALAQCVSIRTSLYGIDHPLTVVAKQELVQLEAMLARAGVPEAANSTPSPILSRTLGTLGSPASLSKSEDKPLSALSINTKLNTTLPCYLTSPLTPKKPSTPKPKKVRPSPRAAMGCLVPAF
mmetsp:Transcript_26227/g.51731  ORF Transcript_26227/g.51731 Transcript_26227/m.51731 type:complete len:274 (-) Transcript_26227:624-1445(-)